jgi:hypothetical protein
MNTGAALGFCAHSPSRFLTVMDESWLLIRQVMLGRFTSFIACHQLHRVPYVNGSAECLQSRCMHAIAGDDGRQRNDESFNCIAFYAHKTWPSYKKKFGGLMDRTTGRLKLSSASTRTVA